MFLTLTQVGNEEAPLLQTAIDNTRGELHVALRGLHYKIDACHYDVGHLDFFEIVSASSSLAHWVPAGLYNLEQLAQYIMGRDPGITIDIIIDDTIVITIPKDKEMWLTKGLALILGIDTSHVLNYSGITLMGRTVGKKRTNNCPHKWLHIHLDQLSTSSNLVDGASSALLAIVPAEAGVIVNVSPPPPPHPMYKKLEVGHVHQLNLRVFDENGAALFACDRYVTAVLEIRKNA